MNIKRAVFAAVGTFSCFALCLGPVAAAMIVASTVVAGLLNRSR